jgi:hypothetical protein
MLQILVLNPGDPFIILAVVKVSGGLLVALALAGVSVLVVGS